MAAFTGRQGTVDFAGQSDLTGGTGATQLLANKWSTSDDRDTHDVTPFNPTGNAKVTLGGLHVITGTMEGFIERDTALDMSHMSDDDIPAAFLLTKTSIGPRTIGFDGILSNFSCNTDVQGPCTWSASFTSSGAITYL